MRMRRHGRRRASVAVGNTTVPATVRRVTTNQDRWARWVLRHRDAGDVQVRQHGASLLAAYRDGVLDRAAVADGDVLLDVGTGDGLIGLAALDRVGPGGQVVFSDISADLLAECRRRAVADGLL